MKLRDLTLALVDGISSLFGHRIYDRFSSKNEPHDQLFCTCGGRIIVDGGRRNPWIIIDSTCRVVTVTVKLFPHLRSDYPIAKVSKWNKPK